MKKNKIKKIWSSIKESPCPPGIDHLNLSQIKAKGFEKAYIDNAYNALNAKSNYSFSKYKQILKIKVKGKEPRVISVPTIRDRLMLKCLLEEISFIERPKVNEIVTKISNAIKSKSFDSYVTFDIQKFYDSINISKLIRMLNKNVNQNISSLNEAALLTNTVDEKNNTKATPKIKENKIGIPQGIIISNSLAEFYLKDFDNQLFSLCDIKYFRFVDDILILFDSNKVSFKTLEAMVSKKLHSLDLFLNEEKTTQNLIANGIEFIGYEFNEKVIRPKRAAILVEEKKIERLIFDYLNCSNSRMNNIEILKWKLDVHIKGMISCNQIRGWVQVYKQTNDTTVFYRLDWLLKKLLKRAKLERKINVASFAKSFQYLSNNNTSNVINFDKLYKKTKDKRILLEKLFKVPKKTSPSIINSLFYSLLKKTIFDIEKDLDFKYFLN